jgi:hypothetical protein
MHPKDNAKRICLFEEAAAAVAVALVAAVVLPAQPVAVAVT